MYPNDESNGSATATSHDVESNGPNMRLLNPIIKAQLLRKAIVEFRVSNLIFRSYFHELIVLRKAK